MQGSPCKGYASDQHQVSTAIMDLELFHVTRPWMPVPQDGHTAHHKATPLPGRLKYAGFFIPSSSSLSFFLSWQPRKFSLFPRPLFGLCKSQVTDCFVHPCPSVSAAQVEWRKADALLPETYADLLPGADAVVHTIGALLEDGSYKAALAKGDFPRLVRAFANGSGEQGNPLARGGAAPKGSYEMLNRDSGLSFFLFGVTANMRPPHLFLSCLQLFAYARHS